jgi:hypothetical protein
MLSSSTLEMEVSGLKWWKKARATFKRQTWSTQTFLMDEPPPAERLICCETERERKIVHADVFRHGFSQRMPAAGASDLL